VLSYVQGGLANIWKENILEDLEIGEQEYIIVREFLTDLKKEFDRENNKIIKVEELKKVEQKNRTMKKSIQEFRRIAKENEYE